MNWFLVNFGKYKDANITLPQLIFRDPDYFYWAQTNGIFTENGVQLGVQAEAVYLKSRNIKIPVPNKSAEYVYDGIRGKFADLKLVNIDQPRHVGSSLTFRKDRIDMFAVRESRNYDKLGNNILITCLKSILFGSSKHI